MAIGTEANNFDIRLVHVSFVDEVDAGLGAGETVVARWKWLNTRQTFERRTHFGFHGDWIEITADADDEFSLKGFVVPSL